MNWWKDRVELLAATAILSLSVGCGLVAAKVALERLLSLMTLHPSFHVAPAPLAMEFPRFFGRPHAIGPSSLP